jgi:hypothetical protein
MSGPPARAHPYDGGRILPVIEFVGPVDRERLAELLAKRGIDPASYSLNGGHPSERYVLGQRGHNWVVYYSERGLETGLRTFQSEDLACRHLVDLLWKRPDRSGSASHPRRCTAHIAAEPGVYRNQRQ